MNGTLALVGGREFTDGCSFDAGLTDGVDEVLLLPSALAYENPGAAIDRATEWFGALGTRVRVLDVYRRADAMDPAAVELAAASALTYVVGGSPMHLRSVLKDTPLLDALVEGWLGGSTIAAAGEAVSVLCSHMVDSRGGAYTVGLDLLTTVTLIPRYNQWSTDKWHRTVELAHKGLPVVGIDEATALIHTPDGTWRVEGAGDVHVFVDGRRADLGALPPVLNPLLSV
ncbi:MAG: Type 1 glutamine amidotransferase-like domain-containing protein [Actinomycetota bacterium]|nr:Type 1 glutamine amidotransferase-like domain-containing protein [Actinomycetota bacterium]